MTNEARKLHEEAKARRTSVVDKAMEIIKTEFRHIVVLASTENDTKKTVTYWGLRGNGHAQNGTLNYISDLRRTEKIEYLKQEIRREEEKLACPKATASASASPA